jgi:hypothetical protein
LRPVLVRSFAGFLLVGCSSSGSNPTTAASSPQDAGVDATSSAPDSGSVDAATIDAYAGPSTLHGTMVDYETEKPIVGMTVTDNGMTVTTDADGGWSLTEPAGSILSPTVTAPLYTNLFFPQSVPAAADIDFGVAVSGTSSTFQLEQSGLANDTTKGLVQVVVVTAPTCPSPVGGTLDVLSPPGTTTVYFGATTLPDSSLTSFQAVTSPRPVAVVYDVPPGATLSLSVSHPTCTQALFPFTYAGRTYTGNVPIQATEPGDYNSALVLMLE